MLFNGLVCWENLNRKPMGFYHQIDRAFRLKFAQKNTSRWTLPTASAKKRWVKSCWIPKNALNPYFIDVESY